MLIEILVNELEDRLKDCENYVAKKQFSYAHSAYDHAFGEVQMFTVLCSNFEEDAINIWNNTYREKFLDILYRD